jgi:hypothetical protein
MRCMMKVGEEQILEMYEIFVFEKLTFHSSFQNAEDRYAHKFSGFNCGREKGFLTLREECKLQDTGSKVRTKKYLGPRRMK